MKNTFILFLLIVLLLQTIKANSKELKIGLITTEKEIIIGSMSSSRLIDLQNQEEIIFKTKASKFKIQKTKDQIYISDNLNNYIGAFQGPIKLISQNKVVFCNNNFYRGNLIIVTSTDKKNITVINEVNLEDYLLSVVPSEIPHGWHKEALKAQAVAARSYAIGFFGRRKEKGYDLESNIEDQVYLGIKSEKKPTTNAVRDTSSIILLTKENKPLIALYHSSGGGYTDNIESLWDKVDIKPSVHIQPRPDYDDNSPYFSWYRNYSLSEISNYLSNSSIGEIRNIIPYSRSISQRVKWISIVGIKGKIQMRGDDFRRTIKLPSSKFNIIIKDGTAKFAGRGNGHGLGLSQWGAKALAENGFSYKEILAHYYPGVKLGKVNSDN